MTVLLGWFGTGNRLTIDEAEHMTRTAPWLRGETRELLWRVEAQRYSYVVDAETETYATTDPELQLRVYPIIRRTKYGATIAHSTYPGGRKKWVDLREDAKQWASETPAEAVAQFAERKRRQIYVLKRKLARAEREFNLANVPPSPQPA